MDRDYMREKLTQYARLLDGCPTPADEVTRAALDRKESTVKQILKRLDPDLAAFTTENRTARRETRTALERGLGILDDRDEWAVKLAPESPVLPADQLHPWIWDTARSLWDTTITARLSRPPRPR